MMKSKSLILLVSLLLYGCNLPSLSPKIIDADGKVGRKSITLYNVKKLSIQDPPSNKLAPFPSNIPDPKLSADLNGKPYTSGSIYTWPDGSKANLQNGLWMPVKLDNVC